MKDALAAVCAVQERNQSTRILAITILYRITSKRQVNDIISGNGRKALSENLKVKNFYIELLSALFLPSFRKINF